MSVAGLLSVRSGSKRLFRKNVVICDGLRLMEYPLIAMTGSKVIDKMYVSTDDKEMKEIAISYGAEIIDRPWQLAGDIGGDSAVKLHAFKEIEKRQQAEYVVLVNATYPLIISKHIDEAFEDLHNHATAFQTTAIHKVLKPSHLNNHRVLRKDNSILHLFEDSIVAVNVFVTHNIADLYFSNSAFGILKIDREFIKNVDITIDKNMDEVNYVRILADFAASMDQKRLNEGRFIELGYVIDEDEAIDIHNIKDLRVAETLLKLRRESNG